MAFNLIAGVDKLTASCTRSKSAAGTLLRSWNGRGALSGSCACKGLDWDTSVAQVGKGAGVLHAILVQGATAVLPCRDHRLYITNAKVQHDH